MQHRTLVPSLHASILNPNIDFARTPFKVQQQCERWNRPTVSIDGTERQYPLTAGISSFGAGGANAHLIVEEYVAPEMAHECVPSITVERPALIVLSARSDGQLRERARALAAYLQQDPVAVGLPDIAYTLQVGREAMEYRVAFSVVSIAQLREKLTRFAGGAAESEPMDGCHVGEVRSNRTLLAPLSGDPDLQGVIASWIVKGKHARLLDLWV